MILWRNAGPQGFWLMATHCSSFSLLNFLFTKSKLDLFFELYRFKTNLDLVYNSIQYVIIVYNFIILLDTQLQQKNERNCFLISISELSLVIIKGHSPRNH